MDGLVPVAALMATAYAILNFIRYVRGRDWNAAVTLASAWGVGIVTLALFAQTEWAELIPLEITGGVPLGELSIASLIVLGLQIGSSASAFNDVRGSLGMNIDLGRPRLLDGKLNDRMVGQLEVEYDEIHETG